MWHQAESGPSGATSRQAGFDPLRFYEFARSLPKSGRSKLKPSTSGRDRLT